MKKVLAALLMVCICLSMVIPVLSTTFVYADNYFSIDYSNEVSTLYFPFIYTDEDWLNQLIGENSCTTGYVYCQNYSTGEIHLILSKPTKIILETPNALFCVTENNTIVRTDYLGLRQETIYTAAYGSITVAARDGSDIYLSEDSNLVYFDAESYSSTLLYRTENIVAMLPISEQRLTWRDSSGQEYLLDLSTKQNTALSDQDLNNLQYSNSTPVVQSSITPYAIQLQLDFPLPDYPAGSYFTNNGLACTDHSISGIHLAGTCNCKMYCGSTQCYGFALYASDQYVHISGNQGSRGASCASIAGYTLKNASTAFSYFRSCPKGSYIRLSETAPSGEGNHSIVLVSVSSSGITIYDCNYEGPCKVSYRFSTYSDLLYRYPYVANAIVHSLTDNRQYSSTYHKIYCSKAGCSGFIYEEHSSVNPGNNATCNVCGYVGYIENIGTIG